MPNVVGILVWWGMLFRCMTTGDIIVLWYTPTTKGYFVPIRHGNWLRARECMKSLTINMNLLKLVAGL